MRPHEEVSCQQAAEKILKAFLMHRQVEFPKTHDLCELLDLVGTCDPGLSAELRGITSLTPYGVDYRYPSDLPSLSRAEAVEALDLARATKAVVE